MFLRYFLLMSTTGFHLVRFDFRDTSTEFFDGSAFVPGPELPYGMELHCSCEVEPGRVFLAGGYSQPDAAFIIDVDSGDVQELPDLPNTRDNGPACGAVEDGSGGYDVVVAGAETDEVDIYNTRLGTWRPGNKRSKNIVRECTLFDSILLTPQAPPSRLRASAGPPTSPTATPSSSLAGRTSQTGLGTHSCTTRSQTRVGPRWRTYRQEFRVTLSCSIKERKHFVLFSRFLG